MLCNGKELHNLIIRFLFYVLSFGIEHSNQAEHDLFMLYNGKELNNINIKCVLCYHFGIEKIDKVSNIKTVLESILT